MKKVRVILADDHRMVTEGLRNLLEPEFEIAGIFEDGRALVKAVQKTHSEVIVVDISMPLLNGIEAVRQIKQIKPDIKVIFLTMHPDMAYATRAFEAGASGYVLKHSAPSELVSAIHEAIKGRIYITPVVAGDLMQAYKDGLDPKQDDAEILTPRQKEVLQLLAEGHSAAEIGEILCISSRTVEFHKYKMMEQLNLKTSAALLGYAIKSGIVTV